jgi:biopolymer transport protein TolR
MAMGVHSSTRGRGRSRRRAAIAEINVTPLVDVMLVLLIIFMVTAPLLTAGVPIELPDSRANPLDQERDQVTISIDQQGAVFIDNNRVPQGGLADALAQRDPAGNAPREYQRPDRGHDYGRVMAVMGELNHAGFNSVSLVTNSSSKAQ